MFSADLSWTDAGAEKVGERRQRIARERSIHSATPSVYSYRSSRASSIADDRELWWASGFRKAKSLTPMRARPSTAQSTDNSRRTSSGLRFITSNLDQEPEEESSPQPDIASSSTMASTIPSVDFLGPPKLDGGLSEFAGDHSSYGSTSSSSFSSNEIPWSLRPAPKVEVVEIRPQMPRSIVVGPAPRSPRSPQSPGNLRSFSPSFNRRKMCVHFHRQ